MGRHKKEGGTGRGLPSLGIRLEPELKTWLEEQAEIEGITASEYVRELIRNYKLNNDTVIPRINVKYGINVSVITIKFEEQMEVIHSEIASITEEINKNENLIVQAEKWLLIARLNKLPKSQLDQLIELIEYYRSEIARLQKLKLRLQIDRHKIVEEIIKERETGNLQDDSDKK